MSKALVIKGANFAANKLTTIVIGDPVPCTGISIIESSVSATDYDPIELTYSVTPEDTTDAIVWTSSNTDVATVAEGVITPVGLGTATITATCGSFSDTVSVTVSIIFSGEYAAPAKAGIDTGLSPNVVTISGSYSKRFSAYGTGNNATTYRAEAVSGFPNELKAFKMPGNTTKVKVSRSADKTSMFDNANSMIVFTKDEHCGNNSFPYAIKPISQEDFRLDQNASVTVNVPSGADSLFVCAAMVDVISDVDAVVESSGFTIEFLAN